MDKNEKPVFAPVVTGNTSVQRKKWYQSFAELFFAQTDPATVAKYVVKDIIAPYCKKLTFDVITSAVEMFLFDSGTAMSKSQMGNRPYVNYNSGYTYTRQQPTTQNSKPVVSGTDIFNFGDVYFDFKSDAERVLDKMCEILEHWPVVTVQDFYNLAGQKIDNVQANKFGWFNLDGAGVANHYNGKFFIKLPKACPIDD